MRPPVTIESRGAARVVTIRRPEVRNALGPEHARLVSEAIDEAASAPDCLAVILTGEGSFSAGGDLNEILAMTAGATADFVSEHVYSDFQAMARSLRDCAVPTIAAVNGAAIGLGLDLALWCDVRFLGPKAKLAQGWAALSLIPGTGGAALLQQVAPGAIWHLMGGAPLDRDQSAATGLGAPVDDALDAAVSLVRRWESAGRQALEQYVLLARSGHPDDAYLRRCADAQGQLLTSERFHATARRLLEANQARRR